MNQFNSKQEVKEYLAAIGQDKSIPFGEKEKIKFWDIASQFGDDKEIAYKTAEVIKSRFNDCDRGDFVAEISGKLLSANKDDKKLAQDFYEITELMYQNQYENKKYGDNFITEEMLSVYHNLVKNNPSDSKVACQILDRMEKGRVSSDDETKSENKLILNMIVNEYKDNKFSEQVMKEIGQQLKYTANIHKKYDGDSDWLQSEDTYSAEKYMQGQFWEDLYQSACIFEHDPRYFVVSLAEHSIEQPKVVEKCIALCEQFSMDYKSMIYGKLAMSGYESNNFKERYADKLNKGEIIVHDGQYSAISGVLDKLNSDVIKRATEQAGNKIYDETYQAQRSRSEPNLSDQDYENREKLSQIVDDILEKEAINKAKSQKNPPSFIYVEEYAGETYGDWAERVYVKDENGKYHPTDIVDELAFGGEGSTAREKMEASGNLLSTNHAVFYRNKSNEDFTILEQNPDFTYRVLDNNTYWRDKDFSVLSHRGANQESVLVSKNPVTGKFEDVPFNINRSHGNYLEGTKQEGNDRKTVIYKRDAKDGKFYADAEFPAGECIASEVDENGKFMASFMTKDGTYKYVGNQSFSSVYKKGKGDKNFQKIDKSHAKQSSANLRLMIEKNKRVK